MHAPWISHLAVPLCYAHVSYYFAVVLVRRKLQV